MTTLPNMITVLIVVRDWMECERMKYKDAVKVQPGEKFKHRRWTGLYTVESVEILSKTVKFRCTNGYTYMHQELRKI